MIKNKLTDLQMYSWSIQMCRQGKLFWWQNQFGMIEWIEIL